MISLNEEVTVITQVVGDYCLLKPFIGWYLSMGVTRIIVSIHDISNLGLHDIVERYKSDKVIFINDPQPETAVDRAHKDIIRNSYVTGGWVIPADLDEFIQYPMDLKSMISEMREYDFALGEMVERVSSTGDLNPYNPEQSIWKQYPKSIFFTKKISQGIIQKIVLCKWNVSFGRGHHFTTGDYLHFPKNSRVHHFKLRDSLVEHLNRRVIARNTLDSGEDLYETNLQLEYFRKTGNKVVLTDFVTEEGWLS